MALINSSGKNLLVYIGGFLSCQTTLVAQRYYNLSNEKHNVHFYHCLPSNFPMRITIEV